MTSTPTVAIVEGPRVLATQEADRIAALLVREEHLMSDVVHAAPSSERWTVDELVDRVIRPAQHRPYGDRRVVIVSSADRMAAAAADRLLLAVEEPVSPTTFLLLCATASVLPVTLRGRAAQTVTVNSSAAQLNLLVTSGVDPALASRATTTLSMFPGWLEVAAGDTTATAALCQMFAPPDAPFDWAERTYAALEVFAPYDPVDGQRSGDKALRPARLRSAATAVAVDLKRQCVASGLDDLMYRVARIDTAVTGLARNVNVKHCLAHAASALTLQR